LSLARGVHVALGMTAQTIPAHLADRALIMSALRALDMNPHTHILADGPTVRVVTLDSLGGEYMDCTFFVNAGAVQAFVCNTSTGETWTATAIAELVVSLERTAGIRVNVRGCEPATRALVLGRFRYVTQAIDFDILTGRLGQLSR
jgi:hypothetical protein